MSKKCGATRAPRLKIVVLPANTGLRFLLLVLVTVSSAAYLFYLLAPLRILNDMARAAACLPLDASGADFINSAFPPWAGTWPGCPAAAPESVGEWIVGGLVLLLGAAGLLAWFWPAWQVKSERLLPLQARHAPEILGELEALCQEAGLPEPPVCVWNPQDRETGCLAFGRHGRYYLRLSGSLVSRHDEDRRAFRDAVQPQLARVCNGDVDRRTFAWALWWAFVTLAVVPSILENVSIVARGYTDLTHTLLTAVAQNAPVVGLALFVLLLNNTVPLK